MWIVRSEIDNVPASGYALVDSRNGDLVPLGEALGLPGNDVWPAGSFDGGRWLAAYVALEGTDEATGRHRSGIYVAPSVNLSAGKLVEDSHWILESLDEPPSLFLMKDVSDSSSIVQFSLDTGEADVLLDALPAGQAPPEFMALPGAYALSRATHDLPPDYHPVDVRTYNGDLLGRLVLPPGTDSFRWIALASNRLVFDISDYRIGQGGECELEEVLLHWDLSTVIP